MMDGVSGGMPARAAEWMTDRVMGRLDRDRSGDIAAEEAAGKRRLERNFAAIDGDGDGVLSAEEIGVRMEAKAARMWMGEGRANGLGAWMQMQAAAGDRAVSAYDGMDADGDGALSDAEISAAAEAEAAREAAAAAREAKIAEIGRMDLDGDGRLSSAELQAELTARAEAQAVAEFDRLDADGDGMLSDAELAADMAAGGDAPAMAEGMTEPAAAPAGDENAIPAAEPVTPAAEVDAAAGETPDPEALSLIENVFAELLEDRQASLPEPDLSAMSLQLYARAQEMLIDGLEQAAQAVAGTGGDDPVTPQA